MSLLVLWQDLFLLHSSTAEHNQQVKMIMRNILDQPNCKFTEDIVADMSVIYHCSLDLPLVQNFQFVRRKGESLVHFDHMDGRG